MTRPAEKYWLEEKRNPMITLVEGSHRLAGRFFDLANID